MDYQIPFINLLLMYAFMIFFNFFNFSNRLITTMKVFSIASGTNRNKSEINN